MPARSLKLIEISTLSNARWGSRIPGLQAESRLSSLDGRVMEAGLRQHVRHLTVGNLSRRPTQPSLDRGGDRLQSAKAACGEDFRKFRRHDAIGSELLVRLAGEDLRQLRFFLVRQRVALEAQCALTTAQQARGRPAEPETASARATASRVRNAASAARIRRSGRRCNRSPERRCRAPKPLTHQPAQIGCKRRIAVVDRLVLANEAAQFRRDRAGALFERRIGQHLARLHGQSSPGQPQRAPTRQNRDRS